MKEIPTMNTRKKSANRHAVNPHPCDMEACNCGRTHLGRHAVKSSDYLPDNGAVFISSNEGENNAPPELIITPDAYRGVWMVSLDVGSHHYQYATSVHYSHSPDEVINSLKSQSNGPLTVVVNII
jgi:hypothetical protein